MVLGNVETLFKEYRVFIKYLVLFSAAYLVKCVFEYLYNRSAAKNDNIPPTPDVSKLCIEFLLEYYMCFEFVCWIIYSTSAVDNFYNPCV